MTWSEDISSQELQVVEELKRRVKNDATPSMHKDDSIYYRFAKARDFNLKQAETMIRKHIAWRKEYNVDTILEDYSPPKALLEYAPTNFMCYDKEGSPVRYVDFGKLDFKGILNICKPIDFIKFNIYVVEQDILKLEEQTKKLGKPVQKVMYIYNFEKFSFLKATYKKGIEWMMFGINIYQDNYPERIKSIHVINAPTYYYALFNVLKIVVASAVAEKMKLYGENGWREVFLKIIDANVLPAFLGGNRTDPDGNPLCISYVVHGQNIPEHLYLPKSEKALTRSPGVDSVTVNRMSKVDIPIDVREPGSVLEWTFETRSRDIGFAVRYSDPESKGTKSLELVPNQRIDTYYDMETGIYKCENSGTYILVFDNTYSWIFQKEIFYKVRVIPPAEQQTISNLTFESVSS